MCCSLDIGHISLDAGAAGQSFEADLYAIHYILCKGAMFSGLYCVTLIVNTSHDMLLLYVA